MATIEERVKQIVAEQLGVEEGQVTPDATIPSAIHLIIADGLELVMALEEEFDIEISDEDAEKIQTVQNATEYITQNS